MDIAKIRKKLKGTEPADTLKAEVMEDVKGGEGKPRCPSPRIQVPDSGPKTKKGRH